MTTKTEKRIEDITEEDVEAESKKNISLLLRKFNADSPFIFLIEIFF